MVLFTFDRRQSEEARGSNEGDNGMVRKVEYSVFLTSRKNKIKTTIYIQRTFRLPHLHSFHMLAR